MNNYFERGKAELEMVELKTYKLNEDYLPAIAHFMAAIAEVSQGVQERVNQLVDLEKAKAAETVTEDQPDEQEE